MDISVLDWLGRTASRLGDKTVFSDGETSFTFADVDRISDSVGTFLCGRVSAQRPVVVMSARRALTPSAFLGVVKAGCFYAPIDATMPVSRLNQILSVIRADVMLVDRAFAELAAKLDFSGEIVVLEDVLDTPADAALLHKARAAIISTSPLYVIFTSGSTGVPKGVITSHESLMRYIDAVGTVLSIGEDDVLGNQSPLDYIAAVRDIYLPLHVGASTVIVPKSEFAMPVKLFETLTKNGVTAICWSVAGLDLPVKLGAFAEAKPETIKKVCFSGSAISAKTLRAWQDALPQALFVNQYGPTEATASCTYYVVPEKVAEGEVLPIGVPYKNYGIVLLNEDHTATAPGEIGEICVTGASVTLGYYGAPDKTAESFIQNPLNPYYRETIYKTGDLGRLREDGNLEFHGRKDRQIKHMGHRIELGEIEATAMRVEGVSECVSLYLKEKELLYLFYTGTASAKEITLHFRSVLPAFMVPRKLVALPDIPRLPNGKTDMQALRAQMK